MDASLTWLTDLERKVDAAVRELEALRKENGQFKTKIKRLQEELSRTRGEHQAEEGWEKERQEIRRRVEKLANSLEQLL